MRLIKAFILLFVLMGCARTETIELAEESSKWLTGFDYDDTFDMVDENNISLSWWLTEKNHYYNEGGSGILFITTDRTFRESKYESFHNDVLGKFSILVATDYSPGNDFISFATDNMNVTLTLNDLKITDLYLDYSSGEMTHWNYQFDEPLTSKPIIVESQKLGSKIYGETMIFKLQDFEHVLSDNDIIAFYISKNEGLIYLELKSGLKYYKK